jgi:general secretion pathway protein K
VRTPLTTDRGFALVAVLLVLGLLGLVGAEFSYSMRLEATAARTYKEGIAAAHLAEAAVEQAVREIVGDAAFVTADDDGVLTFYGRDGRALPRLPRTRVPLGAMGTFSYRITDEEARLNLNTTPPDRIDQLLQGLGVTKADRDTINDSLQDWRDANDEHRLNGAESDDYYLKLSVPYRAHNANLESVTELLQIKGVTPEIYNGHDGIRGLVDLVTVKTPGQINMNSASPEVLRAQGLSDAEVIDIVQSRREGPFIVVPGRFGGRGFMVNTRTFRIEAESQIEGQPRARLTAIIQRRQDNANQPIVILEWSGVR